MNDDLLRQLLQRADDDPAPLRGNVAEAVRKRVKCRRAAQLAAAGVAVLGIAVTALVFQHKPADTKHEIAVNPPVGARLTPAIEAEVSRRMVQLAIRQRSPSVTMKSRRADPVAFLEIERSIAAITMLEQADSVREKDHELALKTYRRAMELFPETAAGRTARNRINKPGT